MNRFAERATNPRLPGSETGVIVNPLYDGSDSEDGEGDSTLQALAEDEEDEDEMELAGSDSGEAVLGEPTYEYELEGCGGESEQQDSEEGAGSAQGAAPTPLRGAAGRAASLRSLGPADVSDAASDTDEDSALLQRLPIFGVNGPVQHADVVVVGGGVSGMTAAYRLRMAGVNRVVVLEAKDRLGGRTLTQTVYDASGREGTIDLGGQWLSSSQPHAMALAQELNMDLFRQHDEGVRLMQLSDGRVRPYEGLIPSLSLAELLNSQYLLTVTDSMAATASVDAPLQTPNAAALDAHSLSSYVHGISWFQSLRELMQILSRIVFGCEPESLSALYFILYVAGAGSAATLCEATDGGGQEFRIVGGAQQFADKMAAEVGLGNVHINTPVAAVSQGVDHALVYTYTGDVFRAEHVVMAVPPTEAGKIAFDPPLSPQKAHLFQHMPMGHIIKVLVTYTDSFWRDAGFSGESISSVGPITITMDATTGEGVPAVVSFICGKHATYWTEQDAEARRAAVLQHLRTLFGTDDALHPATYTEKDWAKEPFNGGCPVSVMTTGTCSQFGSAIRTPEGRLHWAGTETATVWFGFINGAIQAGNRAAREILHRRGLAVPFEENPPTAADQERRAGKGLVAVARRTCSALQADPLTLIATAAAVAAVGWLWYRRA